MSARFKGRFMVTPGITRKQSAWLRSVTNESHRYKRVPDGFCDWIFGDDTFTSTILCWNGNEKFREPVAWLEYIVVELKASGFQVSGCVRWTDSDYNYDAKIYCSETGVRLVERDDDEWVSDVTSD